LTVPDDRAWTVYIIQAESGSLYTGITSDLERRLAEHRSSARGAKFFRTSSPRRVVFQEVRRGRGDAQRREREIKGMSRVEKLALIRRQACE
jgi:putative endonuclease